MAVQIVNFTQDELGPAWALRKQIESIPSVGIGVIDLGDMLVTAGAGFGVNIATGTATVRQTVASEGGGSNAYYNSVYTAFNDGSASPYNTVSAPLTNPRLDQVILRIYDVQEQGLGGASYGRFEWLAGAETVGATIDNRAGAVATLPANSLRLADVIQTVGEAGTGTIRDRRSLATAIIPPSVKTSIVAQGFVPLPGFALAASVNVGSQSQVATAAFLPRRVVNATKIRWGYSSPVANSGNYNIGIYDASGRIIVSTGAVAVGTNWVTRSETITTTTFEAGMYYIVFGSALTQPISAASIIPCFSDASPLYITSVPNCALYSATGGTALPTTIAGFTDTFAVGGTTAYNLPGPELVLSQA